MGDSQNGFRSFSSKNQPWAGPARPWAAPAQSPFQSKVAAEAAKILSSYEGAHSLAGYDDRWRGRELELEFSTRGHRHNWDGSTSWKWGPADPPSASYTCESSGRGDAGQSGRGDAGQSGGSFGELKNHADDDGRRVIFVFPTEKEQSAKVVGSLAARREAILGQEDEVVHVLKPKVPTFADVGTQCPETKSQGTQTEITGTEWSDADEDQPLLAFGHPLRYERDTFVRGPLGSPRATGASPRRQNAAASPRNGRYSAARKQSRHFHHPDNVYHGRSPSGPRHGTPASPAWARSPRVHRASHSSSPRVTIVREPDDQKSGDARWSHFNGNQNTLSTPQREMLLPSSSPWKPPTRSTGVGVQAQSSTSNSGVMTAPRQDSALKTQDLQVSTTPSVRQQSQYNSTSSQRSTAASEVERSFQHSPTRQINKSRNTQGSDRRNSKQAHATSLAASGRRSQSRQPSNPVNSPRAKSQAFGGNNSRQSSPRTSSTKKRSGGLYRIRRYDAESTYGGKAEAEYADSVGADELKHAKQLAVQAGTETSSGLGGLLNAHHQVNVVKGKPTRFANRDPHFSRYLRDGHTLGPGKHQWTFGLREYDKPRPTEEYLREAEERLGRRFSGDARSFGTFASPTKAANTSPSPRPANNNMTSPAPQSHSKDDTSLQYGSSESTRTTSYSSESIGGSSRNVSQLSTNSWSSVSQQEQHSRSTKRRELAIAKQPLAHAKAQPQSPPRKPQREPALLSWSPPARQGGSHSAPPQNSQQLQAVADFGTFGDISFPTPQRIDRSRTSISKTSTHSQPLYSTTTAAFSRTSPPKNRLSDAVAHGFRVI